MDKLFDYQGNKILLQGLGVNYFVNGVNHRGFNYSTSASGSVVINNPDGAPENTLPAFKLSAEKGFRFVECDVSFTSDNVPVLLHDASIDRTSNGTGNIASLTLAQARQYKFNYILGTEIAGYSDVTIPTFEEFIQLCRKLSLHPYIELKYTYNYTEAQVQMIVDIVNNNGMRGHVSYISFNDTLLMYVKNYDDEARVGLLVSETTGTFYPLNATSITKAKALRTGKNDVFISAYTFSNAACSLCSSELIPLETWGMTMDGNDNVATILALPSYITGVTSDKYDAGVILFNDSIGG